MLDKIKSYLENELSIYCNSSDYIKIYTVIQLYSKDINFIKKYPSINNQVSLFIELINYSIELKIPIFTFVHKTLIMKSIYEILDGINVTRKRIMIHHCEITDSLINDSEKMNEYLKHIDQFKHKIQILNSLTQKLNNVIDKRTIKLTDNLSQLIKSFIYNNHIYIEDYNHGWE